MFGVRAVSRPRGHGQPRRREGIPAHSQSPQIRKTPLGSVLGEKEAEVLGSVSEM